MDALRALALDKQPQLKRSGPAPSISQIMAAILVARDSIAAYEACDAVGVPIGGRNRVPKLAERVAPLLSVTIVTGTGSSGSTAGSHSAASSSTAAPSSGSSCDAANDGDNDGDEELQHAPELGAGSDSELSGDDDAAAAPPAAARDGRGGRRESAGRHEGSGRIIDRMPSCARKFAALPKAYRVIVTADRCHFNGRARDDVCEPATAAMPWWTTPSEDDWQTLKKIQEHTVTSWGKHEKAHPINAFEQVML